MSKVQDVKSNLVVKVESFSVNNIFTNSPDLERGKKGADFDQHTGVLLGGESISCRVMVMVKGEPVRTNLRLSDQELKSFKIRSSNDLYLFLMSKPLIKSLEGGYLLDPPKMDKDGNITAKGGKVQLGKYTVENEREGKLLVLKLSKEVRPSKRWFESVLNWQTEETAVSAELAAIPQGQESTKSN